MEKVLFWTYLSNAVFLINHEIDSAYWEEWNLFKMKGGIGGFLILHFPLLFVVLYGLISVYDFSLAGLIFSLLLSIIGIGAFFIHLYYLLKGRKEFDHPVSKFILTGTLAISLFQLILTIILFIK